MARLYIASQRDLAGRLKRRLLDHAFTGRARPPHKGSPPLRSPPKELRPLEPAAQGTAFPETLA